MTKFPEAAKYITTRREMEAILVLGNHRPLFVFLHVYPIYSSTHVASGHRQYRFSQLPIQMWSWPTQVKACNKCRLFLILRLRCHVWRTALNWIEIVSISIQIEWLFWTSKWETCWPNTSIWGQRENGWHWMSSDSYWVVNWWFSWDSLFTEWCWVEHRKV